MGIEAMTLVRSIGPVNAVPVALPRTQSGQVPVPDITSLFRQGYPLELGCVLPVIEQTELDTIGMLGEEREVDAMTVPSRA
jgi:hypothetical protein